MHLRGLLASADLQLAEDVNELPVEIQALWKEIVIETGPGSLRSLKFSRVWIEPEP